MRNFLFHVLLVLIFMVSSAQSCEDKKNCHAFKAEISYDGAEELTVQLTNGTAPFTYAWSHGLGAGSVALIPGSGSYTVTVTDFNACKAIAIFTVK